MAATLVLMVVGVTTSAAAGAGAAAGPYNCVVGQGRIALEEGTEGTRDLLAVQQHAPQNGTLEAPRQEPMDGHC